METLTIDFLRRQMYFLVQKIFHCRGKKKKEAFKREKKKQNILLLLSNEGSKVQKGNFSGFRNVFF